MLFVTNSRAKAGSSRTLRKGRASRKAKAKGLMNLD
jgi:hypothetical protein